MLDIYPPLLSATSNGAYRESTYKTTSYYLCLVNPGGHVGEEEVTYLCTKPLRQTKVTIFFLAAGEGARTVTAIFFFGGVILGAAVVLTGVGIGFGFWVAFGAEVAVGIGGTTGAA